MKSRRANVTRRKLLKSEKRIGRQGFLLLNE